MIKLPNPGNYPHGYYNTREDSDGPDFCEEVEKEGFRAHESDDHDPAKAHILTPDAEALVERWSKDISGHFGQTIQGFLSECAVHCEDDIEILDCRYPIITFEDVWAYLDYLCSEDVA